MLLSVRMIALATKPEQEKPMHLPFGKHKNTPIRGIPSDYLLWVLKSVDTLSSGMRAAIGNELRSGNIPTPAPHLREEPTCRVFD
jgi:hypothetical protein